MEDPLALEESDVRAIVRLLGDVISSLGDQAGKKHQLMDGLCRLIDADRWAWGLAREAEPGKPPAHLSLFHGGFTEEAYTAFTRAYLHPDMSVIHATFDRELAEKRTHLTRLRQQIDPDNHLARSDAALLWEKAGIHGVIMSLRPLGDGLFSIIGIYRRGSAPYFGNRENRIAHIVLSGVPWLHLPGGSGPSVGSFTLLTPRQRMTLDLLIQGYPRARMDAHLEISLHTANDYAKAVFRHFGVHSQASLIARFRHGDGEDLPCPR